MRNSADFDEKTFRQTKDGTIYGKIKVPTTVSVVWGKLKGKTAPSDYPIPQALRFAKENWTADEAQKWLKDNNIKYITFEPAKETDSIRDASPFIERRYIPAETEFRFDDKKNKLQGYGVVFNEWANIGGFKERVNPGTFARSIKNNDIRALYNHEANYVLGRSKSHPNPTLRLLEDSRGVEFDIDLPNTTFANDLRESIGRGDVSQCSFSFNVVKGGDIWEKGYTERTLVEAKMFDIGPVTFAAYEKTEVKLRSAIIGLGIDYNELNLIIVKANREMELTEEEVRALKATIDILNKYVPTENVPLVNEHTESVGPDSSTLLDKMLEHKNQVRKILGGI